MNINMDDLKHMLTNSGKKKKNHIICAGLIALFVIGAIVGAVIWFMNSRELCEDCFDDYDEDYDEDDFAEEDIEV